MLKTVITEPALAEPVPPVPAAAAKVKEGNGFVPVIRITVPPPALYPSVAVPAAPPAPPG